MGTHAIADVNDLENGDRIVADIEGREIAVFNLDGEYLAYLNYCPHQGGAICEGRTIGRQSASFDRDTLEYTLEWEDDDEILVCPWHNWRFDLRANEFEHDKRFALPSFPVNVEDGKIVVTL